MTEPDAGRHGVDEALERARAAGAKFKAARHGDGETDAALEYAKALDDLSEATDRHTLLSVAEAFKTDAPAE